MDDDIYIEWSEIEQGSAHNKEHEPTKGGKCFICGRRVKRLYPHEAGKVRVYTCRQCIKTIKIIRGDS